MIQKYYPKEVRDFQDLLNNCPSGILRINNDIDSIKTNTPIHYKVTSFLLNLYKEEFLYYAIYTRQLDQSDRYISFSTIKYTYKADFFDTNMFIYSFSDTKARRNLIFKLKKRKIKYEEIDNNLNIFFPRNLKIIRTPTNNYSKQIEY